MTRCLIAIETDVGSRKHPPSLDGTPLLLARQNTLTIVRTEVHACECRLLTRNLKADCMTHQVRWQPLSISGTKNDARQSPDVLLQNGLSVKCHQVLVPVEQPSFSRTMVRRILRCGAAENCSLGNQRF